MTTIRVSRRFRDGATPPGPRASGAEPRTARASGRRPVAPGEYEYGISVWDSEGGRLLG